MTRRIPAAILFIATLTLGALSGTVSTASAGKLAATTSSITLNQLDAHLGGNITFTVSYPDKVKSPRIAVLCYQGGVLVYGEAGAFDHVFVLGGAGSDWLRAGGAASCTAELFYITWNGNNPQQWTSLATTTFDAAG